MSATTGSCRCGAVTYEVRGEAVWSAGCCCRDCARSTGTPYVVWVGFSPDSIVFAGAERRIAETSAGVLRGFCPDCGSPVSYGRGRGYEPATPILYVSAMTLADPEAFPPTEVVWYSQRPAWFSLDTDIPLHPGPSALHADRAYNAVKD